MLHCNIEKARSSRLAANPSSRILPYAEMSTRFPAEEAMDPTPLPSLSPSRSGGACGFGGGYDRGPAGGPLNKAWVMLLLMAPIALMRSSP
jgi:hypothetical protein